MPKTGAKNFDDGPGTARCAESSSGAKARTSTQLVGIPIRGPRSGHGSRTRGAAFALAGSMLAIVPAFPSFGQPDWPCWCRTHARNGAIAVATLPSTWDVDSGRHIKWSTALGSNTFGSPVCVGDRLYIGTASCSAGSHEEETGCLLCVSTRDGSVLWRLCRPALPNRGENMPGCGICSTPACDGDRLWVVTNRGELVCLDSGGFADGTNDGPYQDEPSQAADAADIIWLVDMRAEWGVSPRFGSASSPLIIGPTLVVGTSQRLSGQSGTGPALVAVNKDNGELQWRFDAPFVGAPGGHWSSPSFFDDGAGGVIVFGSADGWLYGLNAAGSDDGKARIAWSFDANPKGSAWGYGADNVWLSFVSTPVVVGDRIFVGMGQDPELGAGRGRIWCVDSSGIGDVSPEVYDWITERYVPNAKSAGLWNYEPWPGSTTTMPLGRVIATVVVGGERLVVADLYGCVHCLDPANGAVAWTHDLLSAMWGTPLLAGDRAYVGTDDGEVVVLSMSDGHEIARNDMKETIMSSMIAVGGVLYVATNSRLYAITEAD